MPPQMDLRAKLSDREAEMLHELRDFLGAINCAELVRRLIVERYANLIHGNSPDAHFQRAIAVLNRRKKLEHSPFVVSDIALVSFRKDLVVIKALGDVYEVPIKEWLLSE